MNKRPARALALVLALSLSAFSLPATAFALEAEGDEAALAETGLSLQTDRQAESWRYSGGEPTMAEESGDERGIEPLAFDLAWTETADGFLSSNGAVIEGAVRKGIDVSEHQGWIDWEAVKASDVDFAIIRCGYGNDWSAQDDRYWQRNVSECERLDIPYGVYIYSYAENLAMAQSEANHTLRLLAGHDPEYPVYYDLEESSMASADKRELLGDMAELFCSQIEAAGYTAGVYANLNWWNNYLTDPVFERWDRWVAQYNVSCWYTGSYGLWQSTSSGSVPGIAGPVDLNFEMVGYTKDVEEDAWFVESGAFRFAYGNGIIDGYGDGLFGPYDAITRGQVATILWRMAGSPARNAADFADVDYGAYYGAAIEWARATGVIHGFTQDGRDVFQPERSITREELAVMLSNYASVCDGVGSLGGVPALSAKPDAHEVSSWAAPQMAWAVECGIINGVQENGTAYLRPQHTATRAEMAQMVTTYLTAVV